MVKMKPMSLTLKNKTMTIFEHIESIKNQCESLLKELKEDSPLDTWFYKNMNQEINTKKNNNGNK